MQAVSTFLLVVVVAALALRAVMRQLSCVLPPAKEAGGEDDLELPRRALGASGFDMQ